MEKVANNRQVWNREMSESKPFEEVSKDIHYDVKTRSLGYDWDKLGGYLFTDPSGVRHKGGMNLFQARTVNVGSRTSMPREKSEW